MQDREFNLLDEKWIRVLRRDGEVTEVSLTDALLHAHEYVDLAGETPTQDAAMLRLLLAVLHTVFSRVNENGDADPISYKQQAELRWRALWNAQRLPEKPIRDYLGKWRDRFWLFDAERPFYQVPEAANGTEYGTAKLNGELLESNNKLRLFTMCSGAYKEKMTYAQAARWLLHVNAYDDGSGKPKKEKGEGKMPSPGVGWLGKLGLIFAVGTNLFETLLYNLILLRDKNNLWEEEKPCWELDKPRSAQRTEIALPDNPSELLTIQSRRLYLQRNNGEVTGYCLLGGDFFKQEDAFTEQMTLWKQQRKNKRILQTMQPQRHDPVRLIWQEFPSVITADTESSTGNKKRQPGIISWLAELRYHEIYENPMIRYRITGIAYGDKNSSVVDSFSDTLSFHADLLTEIGQTWQERIKLEIDKCEKSAGIIAALADELALAAGGDDDPQSARRRAARLHARTQFYFSIDTEFRKWLEGIDPQTDDEEKIDEWRYRVRKIVLNIGEQMVLHAGSNAFAGRSISIDEDDSVSGKKQKKKVQRHCSAPEAYNRFRSVIYKIYLKNKR